MSDRNIYSAPPDFLARLRAILPGMTRADLEAFEALVVQDCVIADDGGAHPELVAWVQRILDRRAGGAVPVPVPVGPFPKTGPAAAEVVA
jgi:glutathione S-transferase